MRLEDLFPDFKTLQASGFAGLACPKPAIMIAMTPRTGSTYLCSALHQAGLSHLPDEIFNPRGPVQHICERLHPQTFATYIAGLAAEADPIFVFKLAWLDAVPLAPALTRLFPALRVIYLDRRNVAAQAVSQFRAEISGIWHARPGQKIKTFDPTGAFDLPRILGLVQELEQDKQHWENWFTTHQISPLRLEYRQLETSLPQTLQQIAQHMNLPLNPTQAGGALLKLADNTSTDWTERVQRRLYNLS